MKPDRSRSADDPVAPADRLQRAHLVAPDDRSHTLHRSPAPADLAELVQWFWVPVWSVRPGREAVQQVLQYPCALIVVTEEYARFGGVATGLSTTVLRGDGWAVGVLLQPAAGSLLCGGSMAGFTDRHVELAELFGADGAAFAAALRATMARGAAHDAGARAHAVAAAGEFCRRALPVDDEGRLVNRVVAYVEEHHEVVRVAQLAEHFGCSERSLQRLVRRRLGLTPKWLIQRRRLQEASLRLRAHEPARTLADLAAELGYADQAHLVRDFRTVTGSTPAAFAARYERGVD
ncbi:MAG: helix-turn-helix domain-containing protein [Microthrixaceae bacterium]